MGSNPENMIKKAISETIAEEMFRDLGFYVLKFGQENTINPLIQLERFVKECGGKFKLKHWEDPLEEITFLKKMPDFVLIDKEGNTFFLEVKFSKRGQLNENGAEVWQIYPKTIIFIVNLEVGTSIVYPEEENHAEVPQELKDTRFHIWYKEEDIKEGCKSRTISLKEWLESLFQIDAKGLIEEYEKYVVKWLTEKEIL
ncbi:hypothetical protein KAT24_02220 [Candidatus Pacearchaeota archaeon]|nr:hypothetical protein [Candidatus Pacearchaeota archaeon]